MYKFVCVQIVYKALKTAAFRLGTQRQFQNFRLRRFVSSDPFPQSPFPCCFGICEMYVRALARHKVMYARPKRLLVALNPDLWWADEKR